jgi:hypothetical protein
MTMVLLFVSMQASGQVCAGFAVDGGVGFVSKSAGVTFVQSTTGCTGSWFASIPVNGWIIVGPSSTASTFYVTGRKNGGNGNLACETGSGSPISWTLSRTGIAVNSNDCVNTSFTPLSIGSGEYLRITSISGSVLLDEVCFGGGLIPVELTSFRAFLRDGHVELRWTTATEINNYGFEVERLDGTAGDWKYLGFVTGHGNSNTEKNYSYIDNSLPSRVVRYRLRQVDRDGTTDYSEIVTVAPVMDNANWQLCSYPNPVAGGANVSFTLPEEMQVSVSIYDMLGRQMDVLAWQLSLPQGTHMFPFNAHGLRSGQYLLVLETPGGYQSTPVNIVQ